VLDTETLQRDRDNRLEIVAQTLRVKPVPCFLARAFFHCSLDDEELREVGHPKQDEEEEGNDQGNDQLTARDLDMLLLRMPTVWDTLSTHAWYMRELAYAVLVCWRTSVTELAHRTPQQNHRTHSRTGHNRGCQTYRNNQVQWKSERSSLIAATYRQYDITTHPLLSRSDEVLWQLCQDGLHGFGSDRGTLKIDSVMQARPDARTNNVSSPQNALSAIQQRRCNNVMVAIKVRKAMDKHEQDTRWKHAFDQRRTKVRRFLRAACRWKRFLLVLNMQQRLILQRMRSSSVASAFGNMTSFCNHVIGVPDRKSIRDTIFTTRNLVDNALYTSGLNIGTDEKDNYKYWTEPTLKVDRDLLETLFRQLFQSIQANTIVQNIRRVLNIESTTQDIDTMWTQYFDASSTTAGQNHLPFCSAQQWQQSYCSRLKIPQLSK